MWKKGHDLPLDYTVTAHFGGCSAATNVKLVESRHFLNASIKPGLCPVCHWEVSCAQSVCCGLRGEAPSDIFLLRIITGLGSVKPKM